MKRDALSDGRLPVRSFGRAADEPTSELDSDNRAIVIRLLKGEVARGIIVVVASHDPDVAAAFQAEIQLRDGRVSSAMPSCG
jgi:putative ABC transport system ATP-binding protein